jgi:serine/threonine protein kinase
VLDFAVEQGVPVLVMDYAPGGTLRTIHPKEALLSLEQVVLYVKQIAAALQYAYNHNIIHRDVKPENILFGPEQRLLLSDFGLALLVRPSDLMSTQNLAGTLPYTAPEQLRGKPCFASDQYALGIVVYEWLCGRRPFEGSIWQVIHQQQWTAPPPLRDFRPDVPTEVEAVALLAGHRNVAMQPGKVTASCWKLISVKSLLLGMTCELVLGLTYQVFNGVSIRLNDVLVNLVVGMLIGLVIGALMSVRKTDIQPVEMVLWSWQRFARMKHVRNGIAAGLVFGIINALIFLPSGPFLGFFGALAGWLLSELLDGVASDILDSSRRIAPNQGIRRSARNGLLVGLIMALAAGLIIGLFLTLDHTLFIGPTPGPAYGVVRGVAYGLGIGLLAWLFGGGDAWIKHLILRLLLSSSGSIPWNYSRFLDYAAEHLLLRKIGGGYIFIHDLFREYMAVLEPTLPTAQEVSQEESLRIIKKAN